MTDLEDALLDLEVEIDDGGIRPWRRKSLTVVLIAMLLTMCAVTTLVDTWIASGPTSVKTLASDLPCLRCHIEFIAKMKMASVHSPLVNKECTICHTPHGKRVEKQTIRGMSTRWQQTKTAMQWLPLQWLFSVYKTPAARLGVVSKGGVVKRAHANVKGADSVLTAPRDQVCWICHGNLGPEKNMPYQHPPFERGYCTNCHDPHSSDYRVLLKYDERDLCVSCHRVGDEMSRKQVHPPFAGRFCTNCHLPHASNYRAILALDQRDLCFTCHPTVASVSMKPVQHQPFSQANCTGCHEPHGSDDLPLLRAAQPDLCYGCHPGVRLDFLKPSHHPVEAAGLVLCAACHDPHASDYEKLVIARDNDLCFQCHALLIEANYQKSGHGKALCIRCHTPHGSDYTPILRLENTALCMTCHDVRFTSNNTHPAVGWDVRARRTLSCYSTCHDPHGTVFTFMLPFPSGHDALCLECHTRIGVTD